MILGSIDDVHIVTLSSNVSNLGKLTVAEVGSSLPINIRRVFVVGGAPDSIRGKHAHKELTQILVCVSGKCEVTYDDGSQRKETQLDASEKALVVPPGIWTEQLYVGQSSILMVLCDLPYDESDYIRNYDEFLAYRKGMSA